MDLLCAYVREQGYDLRFAIEPKPNEPRGDILLPTIGHAISFINGLDDPDLVGINPEVGHEQMAGLNYAHGIAQALWHGKLFHIDLNGQHGPRFDQDLRFGAGNLREAFWTVDVLQGTAGGPGYDGYVHFDYKPPRTEDLEGVWETARGCMRNYLILREKVQAFRADPEVAEALAAARVGELSQATLGAGETLDELRKATYDAEALAARGLGFDRLEDSEHRGTPRVHVVTERAVFEAVPLRTGDVAGVADEGRSQLVASRRVEVLGRLHLLDDRGRLCFGPRARLVVAREGQEDDEAEQDGEPGRQHPEHARGPIAVREVAALRRAATHQEHGGDREGRHHDGDDEPDQQVHGRGTLLALPPRRSDLVPPPALAGC